MADLMAQVGPVEWEGLKQELMDLPKETLVEMVNLWLRNYWTNQNYWMVYTEAESGFETAGELDGKVWQKAGAIQAFRLKRLLNLGDDVQALAVMFKFTAPQWPSAGFEWEINEITEKKLIMTIHKCPMGTYRKANKLELLPCKHGSPPLYRAMAEVINKNFKTTCLHAHPDPPKEGIMCQWEFILED
jgi:hypothetical protein